MTTPVEYANQNYEKFVDELITLLKIPSISSAPIHNEDMVKTAHWLKDHCLTLGMTHAEVYMTQKHPIVYAEWLGAGADLPTVLVYGHYDVQPADPEDLWTTEAFEPTIRDGKLYARGATDDKGQLFIHAKAFESVMQTRNDFPINIKFILEGEEEVGSESLMEFIDTHTDLLRCDVVVISDSGMPSPDLPAIVYGLRGIVYTELIITGPRKDLHSGMFGGTVHNPAQVIAEIVATLHEADGRVAVEGFYDTVRDISPEEHADSEKMVPIFEKEWHTEASAPQMWGEPGFNSWERIGNRPTLEINGIYGGFIEKGGQKTVIPSWSLAKISCRLVADQDPQEIFELLKKHIEKVTPPTVTADFHVLSSALPVVVERDTPAMQVAIKSYEKVFGKTPVFTREGGTIPVVIAFQQVLKTPVILMGFGLPDDNLHAPDEKITLEMFRKGIETMISFYEGMAEIS